MSNCNLSTHEEYPLNSVQHDVGTNKYIVKLSSPPSGCSSGIFTSKSATVTVDPNISVSKLTYTNHPVILVPNKSMVLEMNSTPPGNGLLFQICILLVLGAAVYFAYNWYKNNKSKILSTPSGNPPSGNKASYSDAPVANVAPLTSIAEQAQPKYTRNQLGGNLSTRNPAPDASVGVAPGGTVSYPPQVIVQHDNSSGLLTGMMIGSMMNSGGGHNSTEIIHEREVIHDNVDHYRGNDDGAATTGTFHDDETTQQATFSSDDAQESTYRSDDTATDTYQSGDDDSFGGDAGGDCGSMSSDD